MSNEMIEQVAKAICIRIRGNEKGWNEFNDCAKAAIQAMREPTEEMKDVAFKRDSYFSYQTYQAMIDAALKED